MAQPFPQNAIVSIEPLGDQAIFLACRDEDAASTIARRIRSAELPWVVDTVQAYRSLAIFYDVRHVDFESGRTILQTQGLLATTEIVEQKPRRHTIPCCYELGLDLDRISEFTRQCRDEIIRLHSETIYTVYAIGFCPGFPYLGYLPDTLAKVPRLDTPRLRVDAGSVGLTGRQTGIYTESRPGGWNIVGRTPYTLVNVADAYFPLKTGDEVVFHPISRNEFEDLRGARLRITSDSEPISCPSKGVP